MTQINGTCETEIDSQKREQTCGCQGKGLGEGWSGRLGLADVSYYAWNGKTTQSNCIAQRTIFSIL